MKTTALVIVDVQRDFLPGGALGVPKGDRIIQPLSLVARDADVVIASRDWHPADHCSFEAQGGPWPPHCVQGTPGAKIAPVVRRLANFTVTKGMDRDKEAYSAFEGSTLRPLRSLEQILKKQGVGRVVVVGLALDYCVRWTALDANALGFDTIVPLNCTQAIDKAGETATLEAFERAGVRWSEFWHE